MGRNDNRRTPKMKRRNARTKMKVRKNRKLAEAKDGRAPAPSPARKPKAVDGYCSCGTHNVGKAKTCRSCHKSGPWSESRLEASRASRGVAGSFWGD